MGRGEAMHPPLVSIIIPVYNGANYMRAAIDSALAQDYPRIEIIVVNDGSDDDGETDRIARSYGTRVRYFSKPNGGVASALNEGLAAMQGDVFCWLSHDDIHLPDKTSRQVAEWERLGRPNEVLIGDYRLIDASGGMVQDVRLDHALLTEKPLYTLLRGSIHGCTVFIPRRIFDEVGQFDEALPTTQDYDLWFRMIWRFRFRHMPDILIESRTHDEQGSKKLDHRVEARALWTRMVSGVPVEERERLEGSSYRFVAATAKFLITCGLADVAEGLLEIAARELAAIEVSVVVMPTPHADRLASTLASLAVQTHPTLEIVILSDPAHPAPQLVTDRFAARARVVEIGAGPSTEAAVGATKGRYVVIMEAGQIALPQFVSAQLLALENGAAAISMAGHWRLERHGALRHVEARAGAPAPDTPQAALMLAPAALKEALHDQNGWRSLLQRHDVAVAGQPLLVTRDEAEASVVLPPASWPRPAVAGRLSSSDVMDCV
jgi:hypothetical protein